MVGIGDVIGDRYEITGVLEPQPVGHLFQANERHGGGTVFLWIVGPRFLPNPEALKWFIHAMTRVFAVKHSNSLALLDVFQHLGCGCLAIQHMEGPTLALLVAKRKADGKPLTRREAWTALTGVASATAQFHALGLTLGALRPEGILMTAQGPKLLDLGVGMAVPRALFLASMQRRGRWWWLAPELREGRPVDRRVDVYSLAALAHFLFYSQRHGWPDGSRRGLFARAGYWLRYGGRPKVSGERAVLIDQAIRRALHGHPIWRPNDVETFCQEVQRALTQTPEPRVRSQTPAGVPVNQQPVKAQPRTPAPAAATVVSAVPAPLVPATTAPANARTVGVQPEAPAHAAPAAATVMAPAGQTPVRAQGPSVDARTAMAKAPRPSAERPSVATDGAPAAPADDSGPILSITAELPPVDPGNPPITAPVDSAKINQLLANEKNRTRELDPGEIEKLLAKSREPDKK